jgi:hypothetical protein
LREKRATVETKLNKEKANLTVKVSFFEIFKAVLFFIFNFSSRMQPKK